MAVAICSQCQRKLQIKPESVGKKIRCPHCQTVFVPAAATAQPPALTSVKKIENAFAAKRKALPVPLIAIGFPLVCLLLGGGGAWFYHLATRPSEQKRDEPVAEAKKPAETPRQDEAAKPEKREEAAPPAPAQANIVPQNPQPAARENPPPVQRPVQMPANAPMPIVPPAPPARVGVGRYRDWIVGIWTDRLARIEFTADGKVSYQGAVAFQGTYRFLGDRSIEITSADAGALNQTGVWQVMVSRTTLRLYRPGQRSSSASLYRRFNPMDDPKAVVVNPGPAPILGSASWPKVESQATGKSLTVLEELEFRNRELVICLALSPNGKMLAACWDRVSLWDISTDPPVLRATIPGHTFQTRSVAFSPDGKLLATGGGTRAVRLWDVSNLPPREVATLPQVHLGNVNAVAFSPDSKTLASGSDDRAVALWDLTQNPPREKAVLRLDKLIARPIHALAFSPNGKLLVAGGDKAWQIWDLAIRRVVKHGALVARGHELPVSFAADNRTVAFAGDNVIRVGTAPSSPALLGHTDKVRELSFSPTGKILASAGDDGRFILWDSATGKRIWSKEYTGRLVGVKFAPSRGASKTPDQFVAAANVSGSITVLHLGYTANADEPPADAKPQAPTEKPAPQSTKPMPPATKPADSDAEATRRLKLVKQLIAERDSEKLKQHDVEARKLDAKAKEACQKLAQELGNTKAGKEAKKLLEKWN